MKHLIFIALIFGAIYQWRTVSDEYLSVPHGPGIMASKTPKQSNITSRTHFKFKDYDITELATFDIEARVLSKKNYRFGRESELSPTDLALGWGKMSDEAVLDKIQISQSGRSYRWRVDSFPIPRREIETHSANMHLIPATDSVKRDIKSVRKGDIVKISGTLVNVKARHDNWRWSSSQTRNDTGAGACELIFVRSLVIMNPS